MNKLWGQFGAATSRLLHQKHFRTWAITLLAIFLVLQLYFVQEMLAAELLFAAGFAVLLVLCGIFYAVGVVGGRGLDLAEAGIRVAARCGRRSLHAIEGVSKKQFRHRHSESAP